MTYLSALAVAFAFFVFVVILTILCGRNKSSIKVQEYSCAFMFSPGLNSVALIRKAKPKWQAGKTNGIGGKVEDIDRVIDIDFPESVCNVREFMEETGRNTCAGDWEYFARIEGDDYKVHFFAGFGKNLTELKNPDESERIEVWNVRGIDSANPLPNLAWLIPLAISHLRGDKGFVIRRELQEDQAKQG